MKSNLAIGDAKSFKATFAGWILNREGIKNPHGPFSVELYEDRSKANVCYSARIHPTLEAIPLSPKLTVIDAACTISAMFEQCVTPWNPEPRNPEVAR